MGGGSQQGREAQDAPPQFVQTCSLCHGSDGRGTDRAPTVVNAAHMQSLSDSDIATIITKGKGRMPAFSLPAETVDVLVRYILHAQSDYVRYSGAR